MASKVCIPCGALIERTVMQVVTTLRGRAVLAIPGSAGREKDCIILTACRTHGVGFLADERRLNVALSRARRLLVVISHADAISKMPGAFQRLREIARKRLWEVDLATRSGQQLLAEVSVQSGLS
jgi:superfamily I DNA and/or RNA helicase